MELTLPLLHWDPNVDDSYLEVHSCQSLQVLIEFNFKYRGFTRILAKSVLASTRTGALCQRSLSAVRFVVACAAVASVFYKGPCDTGGKYYAFPMVKASIVITIVACLLHETLSAVRFLYQIVLMVRLRRIGKKAQSMLSSAEQRSLRQANYGTIKSEPLVDPTAAVAAESDAAANEENFDELTWQDLTLSEKSEVRPRACGVRGGACLVVLSTAGRFECAESSRSVVWIVRVRVRVRLRECWFAIVRPCCSNTS